MKYPDNRNVECILKEALANPLPKEAAHRLDATLASLYGVAQNTPQPHASRRRTARIAIAIAASLTMVAGAGAFAASRLIPLQPGTPAFFEQGQNLPVFNGLKTAASMQANVGQTVQAGSVNVTLDSITCDRNIMFFFMTLEKEGGFDLESAALYPESRENGWSRARMLSPLLSYRLSSNGQDLSTGSVQTLDVYEENGTLKVMQRIVPDNVLPDQVDVELDGVGFWDEEPQAQEFSLNAGLDLSGVEYPRNISDKQLCFATSQGENKLSIQRFTVSELGCIMIANPEPNIENDVADETSTNSEANPSGLLPEMLIVADSEGNVLTPISASNENGPGRTSSGAHIIEFVGISPNATNVTLTPLSYRDLSSMSQEERVGLYGQWMRTVDLSKPDVDLPTSEYGGYKLSERTVADHTLTLKLEPYGWAGHIELIPQDDVTMLESTWTDPYTGESGTGYHSAIEWQRQDPLTGELLIMMSYYAASDEEISHLANFSYPAEFNCYTKEDSAAQTMNF